MTTFDFGFFDDNGTTTYICAKCRKEAIEIYCQEKGCPKEWIKKHVIIRNLGRNSNG